VRATKKINQDITAKVVKIPGAPFLYRQFKKFRNRIYYYQDFFKFRKMNDGRFSVKFSDRAPQLLDNTAFTEIEPHYTYHPAWAARILARTKPDRHVDFSSYLPFNTIVSAFIPIDFYDYRPAHLLLDNLQTKSGDLLAMPFKDNSINSLSCLHTIEHVGLGRYGDKLDSEGDLKAIRELKRVLAPGGNLLIALPMGKPRVIFNAHRVYSYAQILEYFSGLKLEEFSLIPDNAREIGIIKDATKGMADLQEDACGCFWFKK
jgi:SAM-dependent methyltransferase